MSKIAKTAAMFFPALLILLNWSGAHAQTGACCVGLECIGTMTEEECQQQGGIWYEGEDCDAGFQCPTPPVETCIDASSWDNGDHDGVDGVRPPDGWILEGIIDDFQLEEETNITCMRVVFIDTYPGYPSGILSARLRIYLAPNGIYGLNWPVDGEIPRYDYVYTDVDLNEIDLGYDEFGGDVIAYDLCSPDGFTLPAGSYGAYLTFPGIGHNGLFWASAPTIGNDTSAVWGPDVPTPSGITDFADVSFHFGESTCGSICGRYVIGDYNGSGEVNIADVVDMFSRLKTGSPRYPELECECPGGSGNLWAVRADVNNSCTFNLADPIYLYSSLTHWRPLHPCEHCAPWP